MFDLLNRLRRRPAMYIGYNSPTHLQSFIHGFTFEKQLASTNELGELSRFNDWVAKKFNYYESTSGWANMIEDQREDKQEALHLFFELLDEYRKVQHKTISESTDIKEDKIDRTWRGYSRMKKTKGKIEAIYKPTPSKLFIQELELDKTWYALIAKDEINRTLSSGNFDCVMDAKNAAIKLFGTNIQSWKDQN